MCGSTPPAIQKFSAIRKKMQVDDQQLLGGILEALTNANEVKMVFISERNIIVMKENENMFFGYANEKELENIPNMVFEKFEFIKISEIDNLALALKAE